MARVIGIGCRERHAEAALVQCTTHVEYRGLVGLQDRVDAVRARRAADQFPPWEVLVQEDGNLLEPRLPGGYRDLVVLERGAGSQAGHYDYVSNRDGPARNHTVRFVIMPLSPGDRDVDLDLSDAEQILAANIDFLSERLGEERFLVCPPSRPQDVEVRGIVEKLASARFLRQLLRDSPAGLALDLEDLELWAERLGLRPRSYFQALPLEKVRYLAAPAGWFSEVAEAFGANRLPALEAVTMTGSSPAEQAGLAEALRGAGATLLEDALSVSYYFADTGRFRHAEIFAGLRYCYQALERVGEYCSRWVAAKMAGLPPLLAGGGKGGGVQAPSPQSGAGGAVPPDGRLSGSPGVPAVTALIEPGAVVEAGATVGGGAVIKNGAVICAGATVEAAVIGGQVYVAAGARVTGGRIEGPAFVGSGATVEGGAVIRGEVWIEEDAVVRGSVLTNHCFVGARTLVDGATLGNNVIVGEECRILPGAYIRRDAILGDNVVFRSEAKNTVILDGVPVRDPQDGRELAAGSEAGHYSYCGDSILGSMVNQGAGSMNSNVKNDWGEVRISVDGWKFATGLSKLGAVIGDLTAIGCLAVLEPGTLIGRACNVYGVKVRGWLQSATVFGEDRLPRRRWTGSLPWTERSLEGRAEPVRQAVLAFEQSGVKRVDPPYPGVRYRLEE